MRLQPKGAPNAMHGRGRMTDLFGHGSKAPLRRASRKRFQRLSYRVRDLIVADFTRCARARLVIQPLHAAHREAIAPRAGRHSADPELVGNLLVIESPRCSENNSRP